MVKFNHQTDKKFLINSLVSVIIPTYNRANLLHRAITSVLNQTFQDFEIIIIDDCSTDNTERIVKSFNDSRIFYIYNKLNQGGAAARNIGISEACGKYVAFLDDDDEWLPKKLEKQIELINKMDDNSMNLFVYSKVIIFEKFRKKILPRRSIKPSEKISDYLFVANGIIHTSSILVSRNIAKRCFFNEMLPRHQDYDFLFKAEKTGVEMFFINIPIVIIHCEEKENPLGKKWSPEFTEKFANEYREFFSNKSYWNFLFIQVILVSAIYISKYFSLRKLLQINLRYITIKNYLAYFYKIFFINIFNKNTKIFF